MKTKEILRNGKAHKVVFDSEDFLELGHLKWHINGMGYVQRYNPATAKHEYLHRVILKVSAEGNVQVDHINGNRLDNRKDNLRKCDCSGNLKNTKKHADASSKYKGVSRDRNKFRANIMANGKRTTLGSYSSEIEAAKAYDEAARDLHGEYARLNF